MNFFLDESWENVNEIAVYGFGKTAKSSIDYLIEKFNVVAIIDNNKKYRDSTGQYNGVPIISFEVFEQSDSKSVKIVILAAGKALFSIKEDLRKSGRTEYVDYAEMDIFLEEWFWRFKKRVHTGKIITSVTTRCTFNCQYCNILMPYHRKPHDYPYEMLRRDAELLFQLIDHVSAFIIQGGEPFLYPRLGAYLEYMGQSWKNKIGNIQLITNGSVLPDIDLLETIKKYDIEVRISDYTEAVPYKERLMSLIDLLEKNKIRYVVFEQKEWIDFGFPHDDVSMGETKEELREHMLKCHAMCQWLHNGRYYYCAMAWGAQECGLFELREGNDYLDLSKLIQNPEEGRKKLLDFYSGNMPDGYMSFCKVCRGFAGTKVVKAGEQIKRR